MKIVASTMPGREKMMSNPRSANQLPVEVCGPYTRINASPTTTGETASGRSMSTLNTRFPGKRWRTNNSDAPSPKIVFPTTVQNATMSVTRNAWSAEGFVSWSHNGPTPCSKVRQNNTPTGRSRMMPTYASATNRKPRRDVVVVAASRTSSSPVLEEVKRQQHDERQDKEHDRHRCGCGRAITLDLAEHEHRGNLSLKWDVS